MRIRRWRPAPWACGGVRRQALTGVVALAVALAVCLALIWFFQRRLIYFPADQPVPPAATVLPGAEDVVFPTADGLRLGGWFVPAGGGAGATTVLVFNGNAGD